MKISRVHQLYRHEPHNEIYGDCYRTAIANVLGLQAHQVPHFTGDFYYGKCENHEVATREWLRERGFDLFSTWYTEDPRDFMSICNPHLIYLLSGKSPRGQWSHVVVAQGGLIIWDPSPKSRPGWAKLDGPCPQNGYWQVEVITQKVDP